MGINISKNPPHPVITKDSAAESQDGTTDVSLVSTANANEDLHLVDRIRAGEDRASEILWRKYIRLLGGYFRSRGVDRETAEDLASQTILTALAQVRDGKFRGHSIVEGRVVSASFRTYCFTIAHNQMSKHLQNQYKKNNISLDENEEQTELIDLTASAEARWARSVNARLMGSDRDVSSRLLFLRSDGQHEVLALHYINKLSHKTIADYLGIRPETVNTRMQEGRESLQRMINLDELNFFCLAWTVAESLPKEETAVRVFRAIDIMGMDIEEFRSNTSFDERRLTELCREGRAKFRSAVPITCRALAEKYVQLISESNARQAFQLRYAPEDLDTTSSGHHTSRFTLERMQAERALLENPDLPYVERESLRVMFSLP